MTAAEQAARAPEPPHPAEFRIMSDTATGLLPFEEGDFLRFQRAVVRVARGLIAVSADSRVTPAMVATIRGLERLNSSLMRPPTMGELSADLGITAPSLTRTIRALEEAGIVRRDADAEDGRRTVILLTEHGRDLIDRTLELRRAWVAERLGVLTGEQITALAAAIPALEAMTAGLDVPRIDAGGWR